eukprot:2949592-Amphidinium_carterae.1
MSQIGIASIGIASLLSGREPEGLAASCIFMIAAGAAPVRAAATTGQDSRDASMTTVVIAVCTNVRLHQRHQKQQMKDVSTQTDQSDATRVAERAGVIYIYHQGRRYHTTVECRAVTSARSQPQRHTRCRVCG